MDHALEQLGLGLRYFINPLQSATHRPFAWGRSEQKQAGPVRSTRKCAPAFEPEPPDGTKTVTENTLWFSPIV